MPSEVTTFGKDLIMPPRHFGLPLLALLCSVLPARSADLTKIERTIANEPQYESKAPKYCLLAFGAEAKTRIWLVADGDAIHVSDNQGELAGPSSRKIPLKKWNNSLLAEVGDITEADGKTKHTSFYLSREGDSWQMSLIVAGKGPANCRVQGAGYDPAEKLQFASRPGDAPIIHFNGPKTLALSGTKPTLGRGETGTWLKLGVGTPGLGKGTFAAFQGCAVPYQVTATLALPSAKDPEETIYVRTAIQNEH